MSKTLDDILDKCYEHNNKGLNSKFDEQVIMYSRLKITEKIYSEIETELVEEVERKAKQKIEDYNRNKRIKEIRKIAFEGIFLALVVGLAVNQITELITMLKGFDKNHIVEWTWVATLLFLAAACLVVFFTFLSQLSDILTKGSKNNEED